MRFEQSDDKDTQEDGPPAVLQTLLSLGKTSIPMVGKTTISKIFVCLSEVSDAREHKSVVAYSHSRILSNLERGHASNSTIGVTFEADGARVCSSCSAFQDDCDHAYGRLLTWSKLIADVEIEPQPENSCFSIDIRTQLRGFLCSFI